MKKRTAWGMAALFVSGIILCSQDPVTMPWWSIGGIGCFILLALWVRRVFLVLLWSVTFWSMMLGSVTVEAQSYPEKWYQEKWCKRHAGKIEMILSGGRRCDCVTEMHAVEFNRAGKWAEAIGQALFFAMKTDKRAMIVLIIEQERGWRHWLRLCEIVERYKLPIDIKVIDNGQR